MSEHIVDLVDYQINRAEIAARKLQEEGLQPEKGGGPVVTISRQLGSGGRRVAEKLSDILGFSIWDAELVEQIAASAKVANRLLAELDERVLSEIEILVRHLVGAPEIGGLRYKRHLTRTLLEIGHLGKAIILGRGANFVLPEALNVRIIASRELRVQNMVRFEDVDAKHALRRIEESDHDRAEFSRRIWGRDWADPMNYDLILRMDELTNEKAAQIVACALRVKLQAAPPKEAPEA